MRLFWFRLAIFLLILRSPRSTLFPYTTLFRSHGAFAIDDVGHRILFVAGDAHEALRRIAERPQASWASPRSEEHTSELQSQSNLVCRLLLEKKNLCSCRRYD